ncbi:MAG: hypothetical protein H6623_07410 [Bdellovibrionaceae bacterium]|nr:hypothetical protein [Pseudobdellovibrionaceae bacterium]
MRYALLFFIITGCSHYSSILPHYHTGKRNPEKKTLSSCTNYIFGFSTKESNLSYANALDNFNLTPENVFSVDERRWVWTWPIYYWRCLDINVNDTYRAQSVSENVSVTKIEQVKPPVEVKPGSITGDFQNDSKRCDKLENSKAEVCRKLIKRQYEGLEKL